MVCDVGLITSLCMVQITLAQRYKWLKSPPKEFFFINCFSIICNVMLLTDWSVWCRRCWRSATKSCKWWWTRLLADPRLAMLVTLLPTSGWTYERRLLLSMLLQVPSAPTSHALLIDLMLHATLHVLEHAHTRTHARTHTHMYNEWIHEYTVDNGSSVWQAYCSATWPY